MKLRAFPSTDTVSAGLQLDHGGAGSETDRAV